MNVGFFSGFYLWCSQSGDHSTKLFNLAKISWLHTRYQIEKTFRKKNQIQNPSIFLPTYYLLELIMKICLFELDFEVFFPKSGKFVSFFSNEKKIVKCHNNFASIIFIKKNNSCIFLAGLLTSSVLS